MRAWFIVIVLCLSTVCSAGDKPKDHVSKKDRQAAEQEYNRARELEKSGHLEDALQASAHATQLHPGNALYITFTEMLRQEIVGGYLDRGNVMADSGDMAGAMAQFRQALAVDPENSYVKQRLRDVMPSDDPDRKRTLQLLASVDQIDLQPSTVKASIHVRGDTRTLYTQIGRVFGVTFQFEQTLSPRSVRFDLDDVDFYTAIRLAQQMTKTFWSPITRTEAIVANDTQEMRRTYERTSLRTFYVGNAVSPAEFTDLINVLRTMLEINLVSIQPAHNAIVARGPRESLDAAGQLIDNLMEARPEVMVEVRVIEFDTDYTSLYGMDLPTSFTLFHVPSEIRRVLGSSAQQVIDQLNKTGTIDPSTIPPSVLQNLQGSPLLSPFVLFGKGFGLMGLVVPPVSAHLSATHSRASTLEHMNLRAMDNEVARLRVGDRFPILMGNFSNVTLTSRGQPSVGNTPQFQYTDLGLTFKVTPHIHSGGEIRLDMELEIIGLGTATINNIPELTNRSFKSNITVKEGEVSVITGAINDQELRSTSGYPGLGQAPVLGTVINTHSNQRTHNQIMVTVVPRVVRRPLHEKGADTIWSVGR